MENKTDGEKLWETIDYINKNTIDGVHVNILTYCWKDYSWEERNHLRELLLKGNHDFIHINGSWEFRLGAGGMLAKKEYFSDDGTYFNPELTKVNKKHIIISDEEKAIALFEEQKDKINKSLVSNDGFWRAETLALIERYIGGEETQAYRYISGHCFKPNGENETIEGQIDRGKWMIDYCIKHIQLHSLKKESDVHQVSNSTINNYNSAQGGSIYQDYSQDNSLNKQTTTIQATQKSTKNSMLEKWYWWVSILGAITFFLVSLKGCGYI